METAPILTIEEVWHDFFRERDKQSRNFLLLYYLPLVKYTAERVGAKLPDSIELEDLISAGVFGLIKAIDAFDPERKVKFETYCVQRIRGSILDELRNTYWVPRLVRAQARKHQHVTQMLKAQFGRIPTEVEMAHELGMEIEVFRRFQRDANAIGLLSLHSTYNESDGDDDFCEMDIHEDKKSQNPLIEAQKRDLKELLTKGFTRAERLVIVLYYYEEMTMKEIGLSLDLSESRVCQMHSSIIARLKAQLDFRKKKFDIM
jgi:RNA polymerase sigma factor for flagellar operon FliA